MKLQHLRRAEASTEYVILLSLVMLCAVGGLMLMSDGIKEVYQEAKVCIDCPVAKTREELDAIRADLEAKQDNGTITNEEKDYLKDVLEEIDRRDNAPPPVDDNSSNTTYDSWTYSFLSYLASAFSWVGGGRYWWEVFGLV